MPSPEQQVEGLEQLDLAARAAGHSAKEFKGNRLAETEISAHRPREDLADHMKDLGDLLALPAGHSVPLEGLSKDSMEVVFPVVIHSEVFRPAIHSVASPEASMVAGLEAFMAAAIDNYVIARVC
jgi:hypothetical protein